MLHLQHHRPIKPAHCHHLGDLYEYLREQGLDGLQGEGRPNCIHVGLGVRAAEVGAQSKRARLRRPGDPERSGRDVDGQ